MGIKSLLDNPIESRPLYEAMGFSESNDVTNKVFREIKAAHRDIFWLISLARDIRKWRFIRVCSVCKRWHDGEGWIEPKLKETDIEGITSNGQEINGEIIELVYPQGKQTYTFCPECYNEYYKDEIEAGILTAV